MRSRRGPICRTLKNLNFRDLPLQEAINLTLQNSRVMRDLGATVLRNPELIRSTLDPALAYTDPRFGEEAALSAFDATYSAGAIFDDIHRRFNNQAFGRLGYLNQDLGVVSSEFSKTAATGTQMAFRNIIEYDYNNNVANLFNQGGFFSGSYSSIMEAEIRQPLLQGGGLLVNRIAGPGGSPGVANGVLVARIRTDISLADFEVGIRNLISNVENAYWDLYFAYRDLDAKVRARDNALKALRDVKNNAGTEKGSADKLGQAEEQYWRFKAEVQDALNGRVLDATQTSNGSSGGTFRRLGGVRLSERRLRLIIGLPINDDSFLRPMDEPPTAPIQFDWNTIVMESCTYRTELRKQRWIVKQRELELIANKNFLLPRLDTVGRYRLQGFGDDLIGNSGTTQQERGAINNFYGSANPSFNFGMEFSMPLGFRQAHAAVRNSELRLARERAILNEQKRQIEFDLSNSYNDIRRSFEVVQSQYYRRQAGFEQVAAIELAVENGRAPLDLLLEAQRRLLDAEVQYFQARVEYALAIKNLHYEKGTLLEYSNINLAEGRSAAGAYVDAAKLFASQGTLMDYTCRDVTVSNRAAPQGYLPQDCGLGVTMIEALPGVPPQATDSQATDSQATDSQATDEADENSQNSSSAESPQMESPDATDSGPSDATLEDYLQSEDSLPSNAGKPTATGAAFQAASNQVPRPAAEQNVDLPVTEDSGLIPATVQNAEAVK